jgi:hypothetical protein
LEDAEADEVMGETHEDEGCRVGLGAWQSEKPKSEAG